MSKAPPKRLIVGIAGASGVIYGIRTLEILKRAGVETHLVMSPLEFMRRPAALVPWSKLYGSGRPDSSPSPQAAPGRHRAVAGGSGTGQSAQDATAPEHRPRLAPNLKGC